MNFFYGIFLKKINFNLFNSFNINICRNTDEEKGQLK